MDILIIGNGFDLAHGLKTTYKDFLDYCERLPLDNEFRNNLWLKYFWEISKTNKIIGGTWIDFETEIYNQIRKLSSVAQGTLQTHTSNANLDYKTPSIDAYFKSIEDTPYSIIQNGQNVYLKTNSEKINFIYSQLRDFTQKFEMYLVEEINAKLIDIANLKYRLNLQSMSQLMVISFNYTDTCEKLYDRKFNSYSNFGIKLIYVHGKANANTEDCNLVLGTHSFDKNGEDKSLMADLNVFQKHNQRHKYCTIEAYQDFLKKIIDPRRIIHPVFHVIGHSLDKTDHNVLKHIFTTNKNSVINIYYHDEATQEKLINNITKIIGEAEVMTKVRLIHQHDKNHGLLRPIKK